MTDNLFILLSIFTFIFQYLDIFIQYIFFYFTACWPRWPNENHLFVSWRSGV